MDEHTFSILEISEYFCIKVSSCGDVTWIEDLEDFSHPGIVTLYTKDIPYLIKALQSALEFTNDVVTKPA